MAKSEKSCPWQLVCLVLCRLCAVWLSEIWFVCFFCDATAFQTDTDSPHPITRNLLESNSIHVHVDTIWHEIRGFLNAAGFSQLVATTPRWVSLLEFLRGVHSPECATFLTVSQFAGFFYISVHVYNLSFLSTSRLCNVSDSALDTTPNRRYSTQINDAGSVV